jgi:two-component system, sensor histidine kinase and response regulator
MTTSSLTTVRTGQDVQRVLLVDDRRSNLMALRALLEPLECEIVLAESGEEALQRLLVEDFAVILLDVQLPGLDGFEVAELIKQRERTRHVPLIFLTATTGQQTAMRGYSVGAVDFVSKPFDPVVLRSKVQAFLELSVANTQLRRQAEELAVMLAEREANAALLAEQAEELQRSNAELDHLATIASHDLAEPLRVVAGYSELLRERCRHWDDEEADQIAAAIERGVARMQRLIDGMLIYARASTDVPTEQVPVNEVVAEVLLALEALISERDADIDVAQLPTITYNRTQLSQVLQNLISNAVKFVPPGRRPTVRIWAEREDGTATLCVADNGMGVTDEERQSIFDIFAARDADAPKPGIGLAVCARIAERNGGSLDVMLGPEGGSVFLFEIPDDRAEPSATNLRRRS